MATSTTTAAPSHHLGDGDAVLKPLTFWTMALTAIGTVIMNPMTTEGSKAWYLTTMPHLCCEVTLWTALLFRDAEWIAWLFRGVMLLLTFSLATTAEASDGLIPVDSGSVLTYLLVAAISDSLMLSLGLVIMFKGEGPVAKQIGVGHFLHGLGFVPHLYAQLLRADGINVYGETTPSLLGFTWVLFVFTTAFGYVVIGFTFAEPWPNAAALVNSVKSVLIGTIITVAFIVTLATLELGGPPPAPVREQEPADPLVKALFKASAQLVGMLGIALVMTLYVRAGAPLLPSRAFPPVVEGQPLLEASHFLSV